MAGLKAAQTIEQLASEEVSYVLVEGQNRVGGRMKKHDDFSNHTVEDGANCKLISTRPVWYSPYVFPCCHFHPSLASTYI